MKVFKITWQNCFMQEGSVKIKATSQALAEAQFNKDFGIDYMIVCTKEMEMDWIDTIIEQAFHEAVEGRTPEQVAALAKHFGIEL